MIARPVITDFVGSAPRIAVDRSGAGEFLLFLHGIGSTRVTWRDQLAHFSRDYFAAAWDGRGYGASDDYAGALDFADDFSSDLLRVLDFYRVERAHLVGLSMGGLIAQCFYFSHPDRVATLCLADTMPGFAGLPADERAKFLSTRKEPLLRGLEPKDIAPGVAQSLLAPQASSNARQRLLATLSTLRKDSHLKALDGMVAVDRAGDLTRITVPVHLIVGELDLLTTPQLSAAMAGEIPGATLTIIAGAGHLTNLEKPEEFNAALEQFLRRHPRLASRAGGAAP
jgi:3-oxoadipate enol-lactonase